MVLTAVVAPGFPQALMRHRLAQWIVFAGMWASLVVSAFTPWGLALALAIFVGSAVDGVRRYAKYRGQIRWSWLDPLIAFVASIVLAVGLRVFVIEAFKIPSSSMSPTLLIGDHIFINKLASPARGTLAVYRQPCDLDRDYVSRIVALENDTIEVRCGVLYVNGAAAPRTLVEANDSYVDEFDGQQSTREVSRYREELDGHTYEVFHTRDEHDGPPGAREFPGYESPSCQAMPGGMVERYEVVGKIAATGAEAACKPFRHYVVPPGHAFMMGDNRENANDSRFWGAVPVENIKGRVVSRWLPWSRIGGIE